MTRLTVNKTYKIFIGGKFPRTESGRFYSLEAKNGQLLANVSQCSRKDFRESVVAARAAQGKWKNASASLRSQILYRIAEVLEGRSEQFVAELSSQGVSRAVARKEVEQTIELFVHYAGWADKYQAIFGTVNPVASPHYDFSMLEPTGVVSIVASETSGLLGLASVIAPIIVGANTCVVLASEKMPLCAITLAEVLNTSDVPGGVVNILTGFRGELLEHFASHMDVNAILLCTDDAKEKALVQEQSIENIKRVKIHPNKPIEESPYHIFDHQEVKTTWHPVGF